MRSLSRGCFFLDFVRLVQLLMYPLRAVNYPAGGRKRMVLSSRRLDLPRLLHACEVIGFIHFKQRTSLREV